MGGLVVDEPERRQVHVGYFTGSVTAGQPSITGLTHHPHPADNINSQDTHGGATTSGSTTFASADLKWMLRRETGDVDHRSRFHPVDQCHFADHHKSSATLSRRSLILSGDHHER